SSPRLHFRQFTDQDLDSVFYGLSHPDIIRYYGISYDSLEATKGQLGWYAGLERSGTGRWWAICDAESGEFIGAGGFSEWSTVHRKAEIGFWLLPEYWGKGYMQEAMPVICQHGFEEMGLHRIEGFVEPANTNCKKAISRLQFVHEGTMRDCEVKDGAFISLDIYAKFKP
ncbi:MAG: GNAT family N-acetyltransferase, partial [Bacteroidota bacterium]